MTDNDKLNNLYSRIKDFEFPECEDSQYQQLVQEVKQGFQIITNGIMAAAELIRKEKENGTTDYGR